MATITPTQDAEAIARRQAAIEAATARREANNPTALADAEAASQVRRDIRAASTVPRDVAKEQATIERMGVTPKSEEDVYDMAVATYGADLPAEFKALQSRLESLKGATDLANQSVLQGVGKDISAYGQSALGAQEQAQAAGAMIQPGLNELQEALKIKSGVGRTPLGTSDTFKQAGLDSYGALTASLRAKGQEMTFKHRSFANTVKNIADFQFGENQQQLAAAETALAKYDMLNQEYQFEQARLDDIVKRQQDYERELELMDKQYQNELSTYAQKLKMDKDYGTVEWNSELGGFVDGYGNITYPDGGSTADWSGEGPEDITDGSPIATKMNNQGQEIRFNCISYLREFGFPNMPWGLYSIQDKKAAVAKAGFTLNQAMPSVGDAVLTTESLPGQNTGHGARIIRIEGNYAILEEANYRSGRVTRGRKLALDDPKVIGFFRSDPSKPAAKPAGIEYLQPGQGGPLNPQILSYKYEGMNPQGVETYEQYSSYQKDEADERVIQAMQNSAGGSRVLGAQLTGLEKSFMAVNQLQTLSDAMEIGGKQKFSYTDADGKTQTSKVDMSPITGFIDKKNPWNANAQEINALLTGTVPTIARGIFGEVGVLTDADIAHYQNTLPTLSQTDEVQKLVTAAMLKTVQYGLRTKMELLAGGGYDVSGYVPMYEEIKNQVASLEQQIGVTKAATQSSVTTKPAADDYISSQNYN